MFPWLQGVVIGVGEMSEFGSVFKMMQSEEVCVVIYCLIHLLLVSHCPQILLAYMIQCIHNIHSKCNVSLSVFAFLCIHSITCTYAIVWMCACAKVTSLQLAVTLCCYCL